MRDAKIKPMALVIAGPNGSGKSSVTEYFDLVGTYTNADDVVKATGMTFSEATQYVDNLRYKSIANNEDFSFETVLSSHYKLDLLKTAKNKGYFIKCVFILTADPKINVARIKARVASGGHDVPEEKTVKRYRSSLLNIKELLKICDILHVYDNSGNKPVRIVRKHKDELSIFPNALWTEEKILNLISD